jgi:serine/threonine-protein kinase
MGEVYEVEHTRLERTFAVKFLANRLRSDPDAVARFKAEAHALARVQSPHVVSIVDNGADAEGVPFFVMERLYGTDLRTLLKRNGVLTAPRACGLVISAAAGLRAVHAVGLIHGDVKPGNLFVCSDGLGLETCKLLDLGLARSAQAPPIGTKRRGAGTVRYMAPEQLADPTSVDQRTDIYALGATLYECLSGRPPHECERVERTMYAIMHSEPAALSGQGLDVPRDLERVVLRALARDPDTRFADVQELIHALEPYAFRNGLRPASAWADSDASTGEIRSSWVPVSRSSWRSRAFTLGGGALLGASMALLPRVWSGGSAEPSRHDQRNFAPAPVEAATIARPTDPASTPEPPASPVPSASASPRGGAVTALSTAGTAVPRPGLGHVRGAPLEATPRPPKATSTPSDAPRRSHFDQKDPYE